MFTKQLEINVFLLVASCVLELLSHSDFRTADELDGDPRRFDSSICFGIFRVKPPVSSRCSGVPLHPQTLNYAPLRLQLC